MTKEVPLYTEPLRWPASKLEARHMRALRTISDDTRLPVTVLLKDAVELYLSLIPKLMESERSSYDLVAEPDSTSSPQS